MLYLLLFSLSVFFTIQTHSYHKSKFIHSANFLSGGIYTRINNINQYFDLKTQNENLSEENARLRNKLENYQLSLEQNYIDSTTFNGSYLFRPVRVIKNSYSATTNILAIDKGSKDSIQQDFGLITPKGILGIVDQTSNNYATVISILNTKSRISAQLKKTNHFGTLSWDGHSPSTVQLIDIPKIAPIKVGDTIVTSGRSVIFPKGILIGTIESFKLDAAENNFEINVSLFNDMTNIEHAYIIEHIDAPEINNLLNLSNEQ
ncbi:rod shape-determining protein MreC [Formosa agariphila KMM 3901]|uniref:Cell shape-determining protein MreC n=1 Tax=Formosa agariphila (strain DSM 15362 / KCTC 12365 / LMG 23005 / KMM 3901 / M-2Alg 35-1) TaxID=1347342 RepID=T2KH47_FORAG|nr:rod shape-determining protein MreC [Formosa agariphila KMM 3901]